MNPWKPHAKAPQDRCEHRILAKGPTAQIAQCVHCGNLSMHLGAITLRLDPAAAESVWATLGEALHELHGQMRALPNTTHVGRA